MLDRCFGICFMCKEAAIIKFWVHPYQEVFKLSFLFYTLKLSSQISLSSICREI